MLMCKLNDHSKLTLDSEKINFMREVRSYYVLLPLLKSKSGLHADNYYNHSCCLMKVKKNIKKGRGPLTSYSFSQRK